MGRWMCQHAMTKGYKATVYNRSKDKAQPLLDARRELGRHAEGRSPSSRTWSSPSSASPRTCARCSSGSDGALAGSKPGTRPGGHDDERAVAGQGDLRGGEGEGRRMRSMPRCRGGDVGAKNAALSIMIGGDKDAVDGGAAAVRVHGQDDRPPGRRRAPGSTRRWSTRS